jgi:hypothetical protein
MYKEYPAEEGKHAARVWWVVGPPHGAVTFMLWTLKPGYPRSVERLYPGGGMPVDVGVHATQYHEYTTEHQCEWIEGTCHYDGSVMAAENLWEQVNGMCHTEEEKNEAIWLYLENVFSHEFMEGDE